MNKYRTSFRIKLMSLLKTLCVNQLQFSPITLTLSLHFLFEHKDIIRDLLKYVLVKYTIESEYVK